jgi:hypothetical protein
MATAAPATLLAIPTADSDPTGPRKPMPVEAALTETRRYVDRSAGPDRANDIDRLRAQMAEANDRVRDLASAEYHLTRSSDVLLSTADEIHRTMVGLRQERDRLQLATSALRDAESAQHVRQLWLDAHPEVVAHLLRLSSRGRRFSGRRGDLQSWDARRGLASTWPVGAGPQMSAGRKSAA